MYYYLKYIYYFSALQYIYTSYSTHKDCPFKFIAQLSFWICLGWAYYFSISSHRNDLLFTLILLQFTVTAGKLYEILFIFKNKKNTIDLIKTSLKNSYLYIYSFVVHFVGLFIAIYLMRNNLKQVNSNNILNTCVVSILYFIIFIVYQKINKICYPESTFHLTDFKNIINLLIFTILIGSYIYITYK